VISESILEGEAVRLRPAEGRDLPAFVDWLRDSEVRFWLALEVSPTIESEREWLLASRSDVSCLTWAIETREGSLIGSVELWGIDEAQGRAMLGIAIQDKTQWGKGYGTETVCQVLRYAFAELGLRRVALTVDVDNERAIRSYRKCGFAEEGLLRAYRLREGRPVDAIAMAVLAEQWTP